MVNKKEDAETLLAFYWPNNKSMPLVCFSISIAPPKRTCVLESVGPSMTICTSTCLG